MKSFALDLIGTQTEEMAKCILKLFQILLLMHYKGIIRDHADIDSVILSQCHVPK